MEVTPYSSKFGFTLIELLITLSVISILTANIFPDIKAIIAQERSTILINNLVGALAYARTESIMKQINIITCQSSNASKCSGSKNWHKGWIIFVDNNRNQQRDPDEQLLRVYAAVTNGTKATYRGNYIKYKPDGRASPNGSFLICNPNIGVGKALIMANSGRVRLSKKKTNGSAITCI